MKILAVIQARMNSTRLPGKVLLPILGKPILWHIHHRLGKCNVDEICVATSTNQNDDKIQKFAENEHIPIFRGSENLVLDRLLGAAKIFHADAIVRVTGDCPLIDPDVINEMIEIYKNRQEIDFVCNTIQRTFPDGLDVEIMSTNFLCRLSDGLREPFMREWFPMYMVEHCNQFNYVNFTNNENISQLRWTVDFIEDFEFIKTIYEELYPEFDVFMMKDVLNLLQSKPDLVKINQKYSANTSVTIYDDLKKLADFKNKHL